MKKIIFLFFLLQLFNLSLPAKADKKNVLFLGNSYTYFNNMPQMIADIANSMGDTLTFDSNTPGGYTAQQHANDNTSLNKIAQGAWDFVSIQCQSQEPSFSPSQVSTQTLPYIIFLDSVIQATNTCAETIFFMTWGRKNGDASNCANYPPVCTYDGMQQRLRDSYLLFADTTNSSVSPVGAAWKKMRDNYPTVELYNPDESHPSVNGTYLAACVFYCSLFQKSCVGSQFLPSGVANSDAFYMQQLAATVVLDSIENWHAQGGIPNANFSYSVSTNPYVYSFTNTSKRYSASTWDFGDGSTTDTTTNPIHAFPNANGSYKVCLEVTTDCGKTDSICQYVSVVGTNVNEIEEEKITIQQNQHALYIFNKLDNCTANLLDMNGKLLETHNLPNGRSTLNLSNFSNGIYTISIYQRGNQVVFKKIMIY